MRAQEGGFGGAPWVRVERYSASGGWGADVKGGGEGA